jgi:potassium/hydrogen antiporter
MTDAVLILVAGALLAAGWVASLLAERFRLPALVLFLGVGMAIGSDGTGWIDFSDYELARTIGVITAVVILFEAGLAIGLRELRPVLRPALSLAIVGTALTAGITGLAAVWLFGFPLRLGLLLGSILAAVDSAAVFALLRRVPLPQRLARTLEGEAGSVDPFAVLLVVTLIALITEPGFGPIDVLALLFQEVVIGALVGVAAGWLGLRSLKAAGDVPDSFHLVGSLAVLALAYGGAAVLHGSGFLAVFIAGLLFGSDENLPARPAQLAFHEGLAAVSDVTLFLTLGLLVFPRQLADVLLEGALLALVIAFIARPIGVAVATAADRFSARERLLLAWAGLRGALPVFLAIFPVVEGIERSVDFFNIVFFTVLVSTLLQGTTVEPLAYRLGLCAPSPSPAPSGR